MRRRLSLLLPLLVAVSGCERPLVDLEPASVTATEPDLAVVQTQAVVPLQIRVSDGDGVQRLTVNGQAASPTSEPGLFLDTLRLGVGLNPVVLAIYDADDNVTVDTLYAVYLPYEAVAGPPLPEPRYEHTATALEDGRGLVAGGFTDGGPAEAAFLVQELAGGVTYAALADSLNHPRAGHTATLLPDGRVLFLGGATGDGAGGLSEFVSEAEVFDAATGTFAVLPSVGEPLQRTEHATVTLTGEDGRVFVYVYGGLEPAGGDAAVTGRLVVFELREEEGEESLVTLSPEGGVGGFAPAYAHALLPLPSEDGAFRALAAAARADGEPVPLAQRFVFRPSVLFFPFEVTAEPVGAPPTALGQFGAAPTDTGLLLFSGGGPLAGGTATGTAATDTLRVYADEPGRFFTFPEAVRLLVPRSRHAATLLPSGRILTLGGIGPDGALAQAELLGPN